MKDTTIADRLQDNKAAAELMSDTSSEDTETQYNGVSLGGMRSIIDADNDGRLISLQPLEPEHDLISLHDYRSPTVDDTSSQWPALSRSMRSMSIGSHVPSLNGTELSASEYATRISKVSKGPSTDGSSSVYTESYPSLNSPSYASSIASESASNPSAGGRGSRAAYAWSTGATSKALFPNAKPTPTSEYDEDYVMITTKDLRQVRWWDPAHEEFEPDYFRSKDLMENRSFSCPFADCEDSYGYDSIDTLKAHLRHTHLDIDFRCPCCHKKFARPSALMAHTESNGKCKVQGSVYFKQVIADISGGFLKAKRVQVPRIYRKDSALVLENGTPVNGIMQTEFTAKLPNKR